MSNYYKGSITWQSVWELAHIKQLPYQREEFNDDEQLLTWHANGHQPRTGHLFDMRQSLQPYTTQVIIRWAEEEKDLEHVGVSYYCMRPGDNLPYHSDTYKRYIERFKLQERQDDIYRYIFFVEDWKPGHIFEVDGTPFTKWWGGDYVGWRFDTPHMAANLGIEPRYTIQLTGVLR